MAAPPSVPARAFALPDLGEGLVEATVVRLLVAEGDVVARDAPLVEVETDKAQVELPSPFAGRVERVLVSPGQVVKVGQPLVSFAEGPEAPAGGPAAPAPPARSAPPAPSPPRSAAADSAVSASAAARTARDQGTGPVPATPATRRLARELGIDLRAVRGSGPGGRVTDADVRAARDSTAAARAETPGAGRPVDGPPGREVATPTGATERPEASAVSSDERTGRPLAAVGLEPPPLPRFEQWGAVEREPLSHLRRTIAERMALSAALVPHVTHFDRADITDLDALIRRNLEAARERRGVALTLTAFLLKAAAGALREHPRFNASLDAAAGELVLKRYCHLGVAVATPRGLIVPVLRDVDGKSLLAVARELAAAAQRAREGKVTLEELRGGCFTITNIGALGGTGAIPIINYPEVAILGVARAREEPVVHQGQITPRLMVPLSLTFDHRVADGADGARFAADIVRRLEHPDQLLLEL
jgi:pyruvate dehydrogenase E2 component (dihydrolipoamide acetyltransferase)